MLGIQEAVIAPRSPWQNAYAERVIGSIRRTASSRDPVEVHRLLQRDADTFIAVERRTQASDCAAAESGQSGEGAARRWTASRIPAAGGMRPIGQISGRHSGQPTCLRPRLVTLSRTALLRNVQRVKERSRRPFHCVLRYVLDRRKNQICCPSFTPHG